MRKVDILYVLTRRPSFVPSNILSSSPLGDFSMWHAVNGAFCALKVVVSIKNHMRFVMLHEFVSHFRDVIPSP